MSKAIYPKEYFKKSHTIKRATCFFIMDFDKRYKPLYDSLKKFFEKNYIKCLRGDELVQPDLIGTILKSLAESEYIITDLTGLNANVFYELGIAHMVKDSHNIILISQNIRSIPFDIAQLRCIEYKNNNLGYKVLENKLKIRLKELEENVYRFQLKQGEEYKLKENIKGDGNNLFSIKIECPYSGMDGIKLRIYFEMFSIKNKKTTKPLQELHLSNQKNQVKLNFVPWNLSLIRFERSNGISNAILNLEKIN